MAGPIPTYLSTQLSAQDAFNVPFGLITLVNNAITAATEAGQFNVTVDCSLFTAEDVSNLRIYLDSQGYLVEFAKGDSQRTLNIDWGKFLDIPGITSTVNQGTSPWIVRLTSGDIEIGTVDQGTGGNSPWLVTRALASTATVTSVVVTTDSTPLLTANENRKGFSIQCKESPLYVVLGNTASTLLYSWYILRLNVLDRDDYTGPIAAVVDSGTATVLVTELV